MIAGRLRAQYNPYKMTKTITFALLGALLGSALIWGFVYLSGLVLEEIGVQLYHSESDQQRNLNIVIAIWMIFAIVGGWLGYKIGKKSRA